MILEKLRAITYRTLFKRVGLLLETHQIPLQAFLEALKAQGVSLFDLISKYTEILFNFYPLLTCYPALILHSILLIDPSF